MCSIAQQQFWKHQVFQHSRKNKKSRSAPEGSVWYQQRVVNSTQVLAVWEGALMYPHHTNSLDAQKLPSLFYHNLLFSPPLHFSDIPCSTWIFSPVTWGAGTAMKTVEDTSSKAISDLIDCDGFEGVYLDYQRQMKFKKGSPRTHLRIFQCPFLPKHI